MEVHNFFRFYHHPHQMQEQYEQYLYHLSLLHNHQLLQNELSCAVSQLSLLHSHKEVHTLYTLNLYQHTLQGFRMLSHRSPHQQICLILCQVMLLPCNMCIRHLLLLCSMSLLDLHKELCYLVMSKVLLSMQESKHLHLLPWNELLQNALLLSCNPEQLPVKKVEYHI